MSGRTIVSAVSSRNTSTRGASIRRIYPAVKRLFSATKNSLRGLGYGIRTEPAIREEAIAFVLALPAGVFIAPSLAWYLAMIAAIVLVLAVEPVSYTHL